MRPAGPHEYGVDDTAPWAERLLTERWRTMDGMAKLALLSEHSLALLRLSLAGLALRYPDATEAELLDRAAALRIGKDEFARWTGRRFEW